MSRYGLADNVEFVYLKVDGTNYTASAATTTATSELVDTLGFACCTFVAGFGAIVTGGAPSFKVQQDAASDGNTAADLAGTAQLPTDAGDNKLIVSEIVYPTQRYLRTVIARADQNATINFLLAILSGPGTKPVTSHTTVQGREVHSSPAEGTA